MLASYFDYIFVHLRQKVRLSPQLGPKFLSTLGPNPSPTRKARPDLQLCTRLAGYTHKKTVIISEFIAIPHSS